LNAKWYAENRDYAQARRKIYTQEHREEIRALVKRWNDKNKGRKASLTRLRLTGCTPEQYVSLVEQQQGLCAICQRPPGKSGLGADHCHTTGIVRGLLCHKCNAGIGLFGDNVDYLWRAISYLQQHHPIGAGHNLAEGS
jgi:hypothetical protein